jgi:hypothetical protein
MRGKISRAAASLGIALALALVGAAGEVRITGQLLSYQDGFVFFTTGDGFRVSPNVAIHDASGGPTTLQPRPRLWARAVFDAQGDVTELDLSRKILPAEDDYALARKYAVALSSPIPNPELGQQAETTHHIPIRVTGRPVLVQFTVEVPPGTPPNANVYIMTDASGWNPQAIAMDRIDALHFRVTRRLNSGTDFLYLYTRGSSQTLERGENGLSRPPREISITDADARSVSDTVYLWTDQASGGNISQPFTLPTPYNPAPFPNLPPGFPTPHP